MAVAAAALAPAGPAAAQQQPVVEKGDQFSPREAGTVEKLSFWYGPYPWMRGAFEAVK